jgi:hypothetical protein
MIKLSHLLLEQLLNEISTNTPLYHRSLRKMNVGDAIEIPKDLTTNKHYLANKMGELALEQERKEIAPDAPSRLNCVYSSLIPRSRFVDKGYLYRVKPTGRIFVADSTLIDTIMERFDIEYYDYIRRYDSYDQQERKAIEQELLQNPSKLTNYLPREAYEYWQGDKPNIAAFGKAALRDIEVLSDGAIVTEVVSESEKSTPFVMGDDVVVTESDKLRANLTLYLNSTTAKGDEVKSNYTPEEINSLLNYIGNNIFDDVKAEPSKYTENSYDFLGNLKKGAKLKIISLASNIRGGRSAYNIAAGKYETIMFDFYVDGKLISRNRINNDKNITHRFTLSKWSNEKVRDYSKYLKKI